MHTESLWAIAELALVIIGLSGIVAVLGQRATGAWTGEDISRMAVMLIVGFRTVFASLLPIVFIHFEIAADILWTLSSGIIGTLQLAMTIALLRLAPRVARDKNHSPVFQNAVISLVFAGIAIHLLNAIGIVFHGSFGAYFLALTLGFMTSCLYFIRLLQIEMISPNLTELGRDR